MRSNDAKSSGEKGATRHRAFVRSRTTFLFLVFAMVYVAIACRLFYVQVVRSDYYRTKAKAFRYRVFPIPASRGVIYDRNGRPLAANIETSSVFANTREMNDVSETAVKVAYLMGKDTASVTQKLNAHDGFVWLGRQMDSCIGDQISKMRCELPGVGFQRDTKRVYPAGCLAAQIIGFTDIDNKGAEGLEQVFNSALTGRPGSYRAELDGARRVIPITRTPIAEREDGKDVYLTIDVTIQNIAEQALATMAKTYDPRSAYAIVMDPKTGEILALANYPTYNLNNARSEKPALWRNRAVADLYEPGSTLKTVTVAAGLNEGFSSHEAMAYCTGREKMEGGRIPCVLHKPYLNGHGSADMYRIIEASCNIGAAHVALRLGADKLIEYEKAFGLMDRCNAGFGCEAVGLPLPKDEWRPIRVANVGFGQGIAVTPLQMTSVYATIANGGVRAMPTIVREIRNSDGSIYKPFKIRSAGRVVSVSAAARMTDMLRYCVDKGTGKPARIDGRTVAGKTGSAQVARADGRGYESGAYIASFMGFAPATNPRLVIAVVVDRPKNSHWGATVAAPVFKEIGEKALWYLKVPSDAPMEKDLKPRPIVKKKTLA